MPTKSSNDNNGIPLSEWVSYFSSTSSVTLEEEHQNSSYLMSALRIAYSLADRICYANEEAGLSPTPGTDWIDSIVVHYSQPGSESDNNVEHEKNSDSLVDVKNVNPKNDEIESFDIEDDVFKELIQQDAFLLEGEQTTVDNNEGRGEYVRAEILSSLFSSRANNNEDLDNDDGDNNIMQQRVL